MFKFSAIRPNQLFIQVKQQVIVQKMLKKRINTSLSRVYVKNLLKF